MDFKVFISYYLISLLLQSFVFILADINNCPSGELFVNCLCNRCNFTRAISTTSLPNDNKLFIMLYNGTKLLKKQKITNKLTSANFTVPFVSEQLAVSQRFNFSCVWGNDFDNLELCRQTVLVRTELLPKYSSRFVKNFSFALSENSKKTNSTLRNKSVKVEYKISKENGNWSGFEFLAQVDKYRFDVKNCQEIEFGVKEASDTGSCWLDGSKLSCEGLLRNSILLTSNIYVAHAMMKNAYGICRTAGSCRRINYHEIFGIIRNVDLLNIRPVGLNVSWSYPKNLMNYISTSVTYTIEICGEKNCFEIHVKRERTAEKRTFIVIKDGIKYNINYTLRLRYTVYQSWEPDVSPWTNKASIVSLSRIPDSSPKIYECEKINFVISLLWEKLNDSSILYYRLMVEKPGKEDEFVTVPVWKCLNNLCRFFYQIMNGEKFHQFRVFSCSKEGCSQISDSYCLVKQLQKEKSRKGHLKEDSLDAGWVVIISLCVIGFFSTLLMYMFRRACKRKSSVDTDVIIKPREPARDVFMAPNPEPIYDTI